MTFPNSFSSWHETHFEVCQWIFKTVDNKGSLPNEVMQNHGTGGLYELAEQLTTEFENANVGRVWDGEFFDEIESFLNSKK
jgi:hypothetical protein